MWSVRNKHHPQDIAQLPEEMLRRQIDSFTDEDEFSPPGFESWISLNDARRILQRGASVPPASPDVLPPPPKPPRKPKRPSQSKPRPKKRRASPLPATSAVSESSVEPALASARASGSRMRWREAEEEDEDLEMTPMIDMTFLLLVFFMVASTISGIALPQSVTGDTEDLNEQVVLVLTLPKDAEPAGEGDLPAAVPMVLRDAHLAFGHDADVVLNEDNLEAEIRNAFRERATLKFILQAPPRTPSGVVREILKIAKQAGAEKSLVAVDVPN